MTDSLTFLGGVGTVTGSKYLVETGGAKILVDCGLFQGHKTLRLRNRQPLSVDPATIDAVVLTHAHLDHSGYLPLLVKNGFKGPVYASDATRDLCDLLLRDSGFLNERDAEFANRHGFSKHDPALPLYTQEDAKKALERFSTVSFGEENNLADQVSAKFHRGGHILGAAIIELTIGDRKVVFSGDLGRTGDPTMLDPAIIAQADYLVVESTYGDRRHDPSDPEEALAEIINRTAARVGTVLIPAFAVGRSHSLLYHLSRLKASKRIPDLPVFLDSPMAINASEIYCAHPDDHRLSAQACRNACAVSTYVQTSEESKALDAQRFPQIIVSASGMATGGRVLHHLKHFASDRRNTILFTGFQAGGTRGADMVAGAKEIKLHGKYLPIRAEVDMLHMLSAHADSDQIIDWLGHFAEPPKQTFVTHGEPAGSQDLARRIRGELKWTCSVPEYLDQAVIA